MLDLIATGYGILVMGCVFALIVGLTHAWVARDDPHRRARLERERYRRAERDAAWAASRRRYVAAVRSVFARLGPAPRFTGAQHRQALNRVWRCWRATTRGWVEQVRQEHTAQQLQAIQDVLADAQREAVRVLRVRRHENPQEHPGVRDIRVAAAVAWKASRVPAPAVKDASVQAQREREAVR